jgi:hypothetical protein
MSGTTLLFELYTSNNTCEEVGPKGGAPTSKSDGQVLRRAYLSHAQYRGQLNSAVIGGLGPRILILDMNYLRLLDPPFYSADLITKISLCAADWLA